MSRQIEVCDRIAHAFQNEAIEELVWKEVISDSVADQLVLAISSE